MILSILIVCSGFLNIYLGYRIYNKGISDGYKLANNQTIIEEKDKKETKGEELSREKEEKEMTAFNNY